ncbi:MAG: NADH-quinone oxidoreductase subunit N [bacterium]
MSIMMPEFLAAGFIVLLLMFDFAVDDYGKFLETALKGRKKILGWAYFVFTLVLLGLLIFWKKEGSLFNGAYVADGISWFSKIVILIAAAVTGLLSINTITLKEKHQGAYYVLLMIATLGMMFMVSSKELITLYIALETTTISLYGLTAIYKKDDLSLEAGLKYVLLGALSSGILLYGISIVYGATGTTYLEKIMVYFSKQQGGPFLTVGLIMMILGVGFKLSMVPMHVWTPDVYMGAPTPVTAFISVASKAAGFVFAIRLFAYSFIDLQHIWVPIMAGLAVLTMTLGNLIAIPQKNIKRLLAYSTISQAGYILVGFVGASVVGTSAVLFYLPVYVFTNMAAFGVIIAFSNAVKSDYIEDYAGLAQKEPMLAMAFLLALLSLAGIPPLAGFVGKFYLFYAAMQKGYAWLVIIAALNSTVSLYYYLLVLKQMYLHDRTKEIEKIKVPITVKVAIILMLVCILLLGLFPTAIMDITIDISQKLFR